MVFLKGHQKRSILGTQILELQLTPPIRRSTIRYTPLFDKIESPRQQETLINDALLSDEKSIRNSP